MTAGPAYERGVEDIDAIGEAPLPRWRTALTGHGAAERAFLEAYRSGRLHHAWLIQGPEGIGKATLAFRIARFLLAHPVFNAPDVATRDTLHVDPGHPAAHAVARLSHPDMFVLRRTLNPDTDKMRGVIAVSDARAALHRFEATSGNAGWRIVIVDSADDMNPNSANALLKMLEEPPPRAIFLIIAHQPRRLLPTVRSRCRALTLEPLSERDLDTVVADLAPDAERERRAEAIRRAHGSPRRALKLIEGDGIEFIGEIEALLDRLPSAETRALHQLADKIARRDKDGAFALFEETLRDFVHGKIHGGVAAGAPLGPLSRLSTELSQLIAANQTGEAYNLDRKQMVLSSIAQLSTALQELGTA